MRWIISFICCLYLITASSTIVNIKADNFGEIAKFYQKLAVNPEETLLVFDVDDTLLTMTQPLGGVAWWDWQYELLNKEPNSKQLFAHNFNDLLKTQSILFQLIKMQPTDQFVTSFVKESAKRGASLLILTARGHEFLDTTVQQLQANQFVDNKNQLLFQAHGILLKNNKLLCGNFKHDVSYQQGISFLSGGDKGQALKCILNKANKKYHYILYVDDSKSNINSIAKAFVDKSDLIIWNVLYTHEHNKQKLFAQSPKMQAESYHQWQNIKKVIVENIKDPNIS